MKAAPVSLADAKRFIRSVNTAFEQTADANTGKTYNMAFAIALDQPLVNKSSAEIKSLLSRISLMLNQFNDDNTLAIQLDIVDHNSVEGQILRGTKEAYDASQEITKEIPKLVDANGK